MSALRTDSFGLRTFDAPNSALSKDLYELRKDFSTLRTDSFGLRTFDDSELRA